MGAGVEAVPADPEDQRAEGCDGHVVARDGLHFAADVFADAGSKQCSTHKASPGTDGVHDRRTGKVNEFGIADAVEPAAIPFPAACNRVNKGSEDQGEDHEFAELDPLSHKTGNDRGCCPGESSLEEEINSGNQASVADGFSGDGWIEEEPPEIQPAIDGGVSVHEGIANKPVGGYRQGEDEQVLGENIDGIFLAAHAGFHHGEAGVHEDHQDGGHQQPEVVGEEGCIEIWQLFGFC